MINDKFCSVLSVFHRRWPNVCMEGNGSLDLRLVNSCQPCRSRSSPFIIMIAACKLGPPSCSLHSLHNLDTAAKNKKYILYFIYERQYYPFLIVMFMVASPGDKCFGGGRHDHRNCN